MTYLEILNIVNPWLSCFQSYFSFITQCVKVSGASYDLSIFPSRVPLGGDFSPFLFILFINTIKILLRIFEILIIPSLMSFCLLMISKYMFNYFFTLTFSNYNLIFTSSVSGHDALIPTYNLSKCHIMSFSK